MIRSPLRFPGGKSRALKQISELIPPFDDFREPFVGGGSVFVYLKQKYPAKRFWINDLHFGLYKFWDMCQRDMDSVLKQVRSWRLQFQNGRELHKFLVSGMQDFDETCKAGAFFILNRITFSGTSESGGYSEQAFKNRFTESSIERLAELRNIMPGTKITNFDYQKVVEEKGDNVFIFLDPPYYSTTKSALYGRNGNLHKTFDHNRFAAVMKKCKHKWLITYDDSAFIRDLFSFAPIIGWDLTYGMRNVGKNSSCVGKELFISNYLSLDVRITQGTLIADDEQIR